MNINDLTIKQAEELANLFKNEATPQRSAGLNEMIGQKVIVRTNSAGVHFGLLVAKDGNEVILQNARRMWSWKAKSGISLSAVAVNGLVEKESNICDPVDKFWTEAIEIISVYDEIAKQIEEIPNAKAR